MFLIRCIFLLAYLNYMGSTSTATRSITSKTTSTAEASDEGNRQGWNKCAHRVSCKTLN